MKMRWLMCDTTFYLFYGSTFSVSMLIIYILFFSVFDSVFVISCVSFSLVYCTVYYFCCPMR